MDRFENNLRDALLRRPSPPAHLADKVVARAATLKRFSALEKRRPIRWLMAAAAVLLVAVVSIVIFERGVNRTHAALEIADGPTYLVTGGASRIAQAGTSIGIGDTVRSGGGAMLRLADGSLVELRSHSEVALQAASDGMLLQLNGGSIIVTAAKQRNGHLYVRTKDVAVSVVGTVFLVNAEEAGSRVAVIQGEVQVQEGTKSEKLRPGQQVATNPLMEIHPLTEEISWSHRASSHVALLEQSAPASSGVAVPARLQFEVVSLRPVPQTATFGSAERLFRCRGVDGIFHATTGDLFNLSFLASELATLPASAVPLGRCVGLVHPGQLVAQAYGVLTNRVSNSSTWPDIYQIEAKAPNPSTVTKAELRQMLQSLLADRYAFRMHREIAEVQGCILVIAKNGPKFKETSGDEEIQPRPTAPTGPMTFTGKFRMKTFADSLCFFACRVPVVDRTGLPGIYDLTVTINFGGLGGGGGGNRGGAGEGDSICSSTVSDALQDQLGLRLDRAKVPVEYLVVDHIEKPSEN
jgi:uncharacterized protein (TIGR03435 family)